MCVLEGMAEPRTINRTMVDEFIFLPQCLRRLFSLARWCPVLERVMLDGVAVVLRVLPGWLTNYHVLRWHVKRNLQYFNELTDDDFLAVPI